MVRWMFVVGLVSSVTGCTAQSNDDGSSFATEAGECDSTPLVIQPDERTSLGFSAQELTAQINALAPPAFTYHPTFPWDPTALTLHVEDPGQTTHVECPAGGVRFEARLQLSSADGHLAFDGAASFLQVGDALTVSLDRDVVTLTDAEIEQAGDVSLASLTPVASWLLADEGVVGAEGRVSLTDCAANYMEQDCSEVDRLGSWP